MSTFSTMIPTQHRHRMPGYRRLRFARNKRAARNTQIPGSSSALQAFLSTMHLPRVPTYYLLIARRAEHPSNSMISEPSLLAWAQCTLQVRLFAGRIQILPLPFRLQDFEGSSDAASRICLLWSLICYIRADFKLRGDPAQRNVVMEYHNIIVIRSPLDGLRSLKGTRVGR